MMKKYLSLQILFLLILNSMNIQSENCNEYVNINGVVRDFDGNLIDSAFVEIKNSDFSSAYVTYTNEKGEYNLKVKKGKYLALGSMRLSEYPLANSKLSKDEQRLEFWCWNLVATENLTINIRYHRLEIYGVNVFSIQGSTPGYTIYCRPMSLTRGFSEPDKKLSEIDLCPNPDEISIKVEINNIPVKLNMYEKVKEFVNQGVLFGYLLHVDFPKALSNKPFDIFKIEMLDKKTGDKGEAIYFLEKNNYY